MTTMQTQHLLYAIGILLAVVAPCLVYAWMRMRDR